MNYHMGKPTSKRCLPSGPDRNANWWNLDLNHVVIRSEFGFK